MLNKEMIDGLWGGTITNFEFNICSHELLFKVKVINNNESLNYWIKMSGVNKLNFYDENTENWDYIELTSIEVDKIILKEKNFYKIEIIFWSTDSGLEIICEAININKKIE